MDAVNQVVGHTPQIQKVLIDFLQPHPRNKEFFDDITDPEEWEAFKESIRTSGVLVPIIITPSPMDKRINWIVSGHQRVRACEELEIQTIPAITKFYQNEDAILKDLIEVNVRSRGGIAGNSTSKTKKILKELERIYGIRQGSAAGVENFSRASNEVLGEADAKRLTQNDLASFMGVSSAQYTRLKQLAPLIPELDERVDDKTLTQSLALSLVKQLPEGDQLALAHQLDIVQAKTKEEVKREVDKWMEQHQREEARKITAANAAVSALKLEKAEVEAKLESLPEEAEEAQERAQKAQIALQEEKRKAREKEAEAVRLADENKRLLVQIEKAKQQPPKVPEDYEAMKAELAQLKEEREKAAASTEHAPKAMEAVEPCGALITTICQYLGRVSTELQHYTNQWIVSGDQATEEATACVESACNDVRRGMRELRNHLRK
ncbi:MAG: ParB N-terminal domain-containing protein [Oscillospiraceae bacterium]|nr:ParB N-terminal domain-containing protein [Oscillospiraceae bacterium]